MKKQDDNLLDDPLNAEIISLMTISNLPAVEKKIWLTLLPEMKEDEKMQLKNNLEKEIEYEQKVTEEARNTFLTSLKKGI